MRIVAAVLVIATSVASADPVQVVAAPPIATAPAGGLDPDVAGRLDTAEGIARAPSAAPGELQTALDLALRLYRSDDPFSKEQRPAATARTVAVLGAIGARATAEKQLVLASQALDARWTISGARDPELAASLVHWGEREAEAHPAQAVWLARRARAADPSSSAAVHLDEQLSINHRRWPARIMVIAGLVAFGVGLFAYAKVKSIESDLSSQPHTRAEVEDMLSSRDTYDVLGTALFIASPTLELGGVVFGISGMHGYVPESPSELPTLERR